MLVTALLWLLAHASPAGACCCTCADAVECYPLCFEEATDRDSCRTACLRSGCGEPLPCPDPAAGEQCAPGELSCVDIASPIAPAPALSPAAVCAAAAALGAIGGAALRRRPRA